MNPTATQRILDLSLALTSEKDREALLSKILDAAMDLAPCDAGTLYLLSGGALCFCRMFTRSQGVRQGGHDDPISKSGSARMNTRRERLSARRPWLSSRASTGRPGWRQTPPAGQFSSPARLRSSSAGAPASPRSATAFRSRERAPILRCSASTNCCNRSIRARPGSTQRGIPARALIRVLFDKHCPDGGRRL